MAERKGLLDEYGIIYAVCKMLPSDDLKLKFPDALAEFEENTCSIHRQAAAF